MFHSITRISQAHKIRCISLHYFSIRISQFRVTAKKPPTFPALFYCAFRSHFLGFIPPEKEAKNMKVESKKPESFRNHGNRKFKDLVQFQLALYKSETSSCSKSETIYKANNTWRCLYQSRTFLMALIVLLLPHS